MKRELKKVAKTKEFLRSTAIMAYLALSMTMPVLASEGAVDEVLKPLNGLKTLVFAVISVVGAIIFALNLMQFSGALKDRETSTMQQAGLGMAGGALMCAIGAVMTFLGL